VNDIVNIWAADQDALPPHSSAQRGGAMKVYLSSTFEDLREHRAAASSIDVIHTNRGRSRSGSEVRTDLPARRWNWERLPGHVEHVVHVPGV
jgi:hypothetical protein